MNCPNTHDWDLLAMETLEEGAAAPLLAHLKVCSDCRGAYEQARRSHLDRIRMYDQLERGHDSLREQLMAALPPQPARSRADGFVRGWRHAGDVAMSITHKLNARATLGLISAAACIGFVVLVMAYAGSHSAFAAAIEQFQKARTIVCRVSSPTPVSAGMVTLQQTGKLYVSAEYGSRLESLMSGVMMNICYTPPRGPVTMVTPPARTYTVIDYQALDHGGTRPYAQPYTSPDAFILALSKLKGHASRELGHKDLDGVDALGYEISGELLGLGSGDHVRSELWVDAKTCLPVRYVAEMPMAQIPGGMYQLVYDQFEWDTPLDPRLFVPEIPADYTRLDATMPAPDEAMLIKALGNYAELSGEYPLALDATTVSTGLAAAVGTRIATARARSEKAPDQQAITQQAAEIGSGISYYQKLAQNGCSPEYHGEDVAPGQADAVLLRWKLPSGQWRTIYGDLRIETVTAQ